MQHDPENGKNPHQTGENWQFNFICRIEPDDSSHFSKLRLSSSTACFPLTEAKIGERLWIVEVAEVPPVEESVRNRYRFLNSGLSLGTEVQVISRTLSGSVIVKFKSHHIGLGANMASQIIVSNDLSWVEQGRVLNTLDLSTSTYLRELPPGTRGRVVGYDKAYQGYSGKLLSMGLTPGTEFTVIRHSPDGEPVEIDVEGDRLHLRLPEANALCIEVIIED